MIIIEVKTKLELDKFKLLYLKGKNEQNLDLTKEVNKLIDLKSQIIEGECQYIAVFHVLNKIDMLIKLADYDPRMMKQ